VHQTRHWTLCPVESTGHRVSPGARTRRLTHRSLSTLRHRVDAASALRAAVTGRARTAGGELARKQVSTNRVFRCTSSGIQMHISWLHSRTDAASGANVRLVSVLGVHTVVALSAGTTSPLRAPRTAHRLRPLPRLRSVLVSHAQAVGGARSSSFSVGSYTARLPYWLKLARRAGTRTLLWIKFMRATTPGPQADAWYA
jgi:hypothetical protein